jgi:hypothetical protein
MGYEMIHNHHQRRGPGNACLVGSLVVLMVTMLLSSGGCNEDARAAAGAQASNATGTNPGRRIAAPAPPAPDLASAPEHALLHPAHDPSAPCTCEEAQQRCGWCRRCNVGYVGGLRVASAVLFEGIDPHGHVLDNESLQLQACREAIRTDGYCDAVGFGFVGGRAYFTRLTYGLARAATVDDACAECRSLLGRTGWCAACSRGVVGNVALTDRTLFTQTAAEFARLRRGIELAQTCETCGVAMVAHHTCPTCLISYESLEPTLLRPSQPLP